MGGFKKVKSSKKGSDRFGDLPEAGQTNNLEAPEVAPIDNGTKKETENSDKPDRCVPFNSRVTKEFDEEFRLISFQKKRKFVELLEDFMEAYKEKHDIGQNDK